MTAAHPEVPLSEERVREYEQMLSAVTPGKWAWGDLEPDSVNRTHSSLLSGGCLANRVLHHEGYWPIAAADAAFIAASPTIVRALLDGYRALEEAARENWRQRREILGENDVLKAANDSLSAEREALAARVEESERARDAWRAFAKHIADCPDCVISHEECAEGSRLFTLVRAADPASR